jgi:uncharacterized repeat protein (TIGR04042 family)
MPEVLLTLEWPDGQSSQLYSPSTVIYDFLRPGDSLPVGEFGERARSALVQASERVRARYGFACTRTDEEQRKLEPWLARFGADQLVRISTGT